MSENATSPRRRNKIQEAEETREKIRNFFRPYRVGTVEWLNEYGLEWTIENFAELALPKNVDDMLVSPEFTQEPHPVCWCLMMYPRGERSRYPDRVVVYLVNMAIWDVEANTSCGIVNINCNISSLRINDPAEFRSVQTGANTRSQAKWCKLEQFITPQKGYLRNKALKVFMTIMQPMLYSTKENAENDEDQQASGPSRANIRI